MDQNAIKDPAYQPRQIITTTRKNTFGKGDILKHKIQCKIDFTTGRKKGNDVNAQDLVTTAVCTLHGSPIKFQEFIETEAFEEIGRFLRRSIRHTNEEEITKTLVYNRKFKKNELQFDDKSVTQLTADIEFTYRFHIQLSPELSSTTLFYENRLIAFFDILGFTNALESIDTKILYADYAELIDQANNEVFIARDSSSNFEKSQFLFDSVVLVSKPITENGNIEKFVLGCSTLMEKAFKLRLPLRGAIATGNFLESNLRNIFLSPAFAKLVRLEKEQEWAGCLVDDEAKSIILKTGITLNNINQSSLLIEYMVPFKKGKTINYTTVNYSYFLNPEDVELGLDYLKGDKKKFRNTKKYLNFIFAQPDDKVPYQNCFIKTIKYPSGLRYILTNAKGYEVIPDKTRRVKGVASYENDIREFEMVFPGANDPT